MQAPSRLFRVLPIGIVAGIVSMLAVSQAARAQAGGPGTGGTKVVVIDVVRVFNDYQLQKDLSSELQQVQGQLQSEAKLRQERVDSVQAAVQAIDPQDPTYRDRVTELLRMQAENKVWFDTTQAAVTRELALWSNNIYQDVVIIVGELARERGYDLVLYRDEYEPGADPEQVKERIRRRKVVWHSPTVDISDAVLQRLNSKYAGQPKIQKLQIMGPGSAPPASPLQTPAPMKPASPR